MAIVFHFIESNLLLPLFQHTAHSDNKPIRQHYFKSVDNDCGIAQCSLSFCKNDFLWFSQILLIVIITWEVIWIRVWKYRLSSSKYSDLCQGGLSFYKLFDFFSAKNITVLWQQRKDRVQLHLTDTVTRFPFSKSSYICQPVRISYEVYTVLPLHNPEDIADIH